MCPDPHLREYYRKDPELLSNGLAVHLAPEDVLHGKGCVACGPHYNKTNQKIPITEKAAYPATEILEPIVRPVDWLKSLALGFDPRNLLQVSLRKIQYI